MALRKSINTRLYSYVQLLLAEKGLTQADIAITIGCSPASVNQVLTGRIRAANVEQGIASVLGYPRFEDLVESSEVFHDWFAGRFLKTEPNRRRLDA